MATAKRRVEMIVVMCVLALCLISVQAGADELTLGPVTGGPTGIGGLTGVKWGAPLTSFSSMKLIKSLPGGDYVGKAGLYRNGDEAFSAEEAPLTNAQFRFVAPGLENVTDEKPESILFTFNGRENADRLMGWIKEWYDPLWPDKYPANSPSESYYGEETLVYLSFDDKTGKGTVWIGSRALNEFYEAYDAAKNGGDC